jgi:uncharacterized protein (DUF488 family)
MSINTSFEWRGFHIRVKATDVRRNVFIFPLEDKGRSLLNYTAKVSNNRLVAQPEVTIKGIETYDLEKVKEYQELVAITIRVREYILKKEKLERWVEQSFQPKLDENNPIV